MLRLHLQASAGAAVPEERFYHWKVVAADLVLKGKFHATGEPVTSLLLVSARYGHERLREMVLEGPLREAEEEAMPSLFVRRMDLEFSRDLVVFTYLTGHLERR